MAIFLGDVAKRHAARDVEEGSGVGVEGVADIRSR